MNLLASFFIPHILPALCIVTATGVLFYFFLKYLRSGFRRQKHDGHPGYTFYGSLLTHLKRPLAFLLPLFLLFIYLRNLPAPQPHARTYFRMTERIIDVLLTLNFAWLLISTLDIFRDYLYHRYDLSKTDNLKERKIRTQVLFIRQLVAGIIIVLTIAAILLRFDSLRRLGAGLLTGVGIGGIIVGFAAQKSLSNLLAGFQIAFTQPIRIDDVLIVEGQWGNVEEITLTYVVVRIWDQRRLILPINYFIEKPFENWTRTSAEILGTVFLYLDYTVPVAALREKLTALLQGNRLWDGRVNVLQVTDAREQSVEIRALMSSPNSGASFDLRCYVREQLILFLRENYPEALPRTRIVIGPPLTGPH